MMARRAIAACLILAFAAVPALAQSTKDPVVARINGTAITRVDLEIIYAGLPAEMRQNVPFEKAAPNLLDRIIPAVLLAQQAQKMKLDSDPIVKRQLFLAQNQTLEDAYNNALFKKEITEARLRKAYDEYAKAAPNKEELHASHILVNNEKDAADVIAQLKKGTDFATLAKTKTTDDTTKSSGGDLGWFGPDDMLPEFYAAAAKLKKGEYSPTALHTQYGWHVIKLEDRRPGKALTYEQEAPVLTQKIMRDLINQRVKDYAAAAKIEVFALDGSKLPEQPGAAPAAKQPPAPKLTAPGAAAQPAPGTPTLAPDTAPGRLKLQ